MSEKLDLKPMGKVVDAMLPAGYTFVLLVIEERTPEMRAAGKAATSQYISPMEHSEAFHAIEACTNALRANPIFNRK